MPTAPSSDVYTALHRFRTVVNSETGESGVFEQGETFDPSKLKIDDPKKLVDQLLGGIDHHGPLIAKKTTDEAKAAVDQSKAADTAAAESEGK